MQPSSTLLFFCSLLHLLQETPPVQFQPICLHLLFCTLWKQPCIISRPQITCCTTDPSNVLDLLHQHAVCILYPSPLNWLDLSMSTCFPRALSRCHLTLFLLIYFTFYLVSLPVSPSSCCSRGVALVVSSWHGGMIPYGSVQEMI